ncbi:MAG: caspase family protein [Verrucomicrobiaceae bacterium]|nr:caspase family protein [Verrucomicrobiaceae bacterium]
MKTSLTVLTLLFCLALSARAERAALVIGNADYASTGHFPDLATTTLDAREMAGLMKASGTFGKVVIRENATRLEMEEALEEFAKVLKPGDEAVFYFAGHGIEYERKVYLMGTNAEFRFKAKLAEEAVSEETVSQTLAATGAKISVLLLDCCRQKPGGDWLASENKSRGAPGGYAAPAPPPNVIVGYATSAGRLANDSLSSADQNGPLVQALRKHWSAGLEFDALWKAVSREVYDSSQKALSQGATGIDLQMPSKYGQTIHDFFFTVPGPATNKPGPEMAQSPTPTPVPPASSDKTAIPEKPAAEDELQYGKWVPGWGEMGYVQSPYSGWSRMVDVSKLPTGSKVRCEQTGKYFLVPPREAKKKGGSLPVQPPGAGRVVQ